MDDNPNVDLNSPEEPESPDEAPAWTFSNEPISPVLTIVPPSPRRTRRMMLFVVAFIVVVIGGWFAIDRYRTSGRLKAVVQRCEQSAKACAEGRYRLAVDHADAAIQTDPEAALGYALRGRAKYFLGDEEGTLADCNEAIRRDPNLAIAYAFRAYVAWLKDSPAAGVRDAERAIELDPNLVEGRIALAFAKLQSGDPDGAIAKATLAIEANGTNPEAYRIRGLAYAATGDEQAKADFDQAVLHSGELAFYLAARSEYLVQLATTQTGEVEHATLERAREDANNAARRDPEYGVARLAIARLAAARERWSEVAAACTTATDLNPRLVSAYLRAADDLSPKRAKRFAILQEFISEEVDLTKCNFEGVWLSAILAGFEQRFFKLGKGAAPFKINSLSYPPEVRLQLTDLKLNLNFWFDASGELRLVSNKIILGTVLRSLNSTCWITPENVEIVSLDSAEEFGLKVKRMVPFTIIAEGDLALRERRRLRFEEALDRPLDNDASKQLAELKEKTLGGLLTVTQTFLTRSSGISVPLYIQYDSIPVETRQILRDLELRRDWLESVPGESLTARTILNRVGQRLTVEARTHYPSVRVHFQTTPDYIALTYDIADKERDESARLSNPKPHAQPRPNAIRILSRGIENVPESAQLYFARGQVYLEQLDLDTAIADFTKAIERNPGYYQAYRQRSIAYSARGLPDDIAKARADALASSPSE